MRPTLPEILFRPSPSACWLSLHRSRCPCHHHAHGIPPFLPDTSRRTVTPGYRFPTFWHLSHIAILGACPDLSFASGSISGICAGAVDGTCLLPHRRASSVARMMCYVKSTVSAAAVDWSFLSWFSTNTHYMLSSYSHAGNQCNYDSCNAGFKFSEGALLVRTCQSNDTWTGSEPVCEGMLPLAIPGVCVRSLSSIILGSSCIITNRRIIMYLHSGRGGKHVDSFNLLSCYTSAAQP